MRKRSSPAHVGSASILLIFTVLSVISFAVLTMVNSKADYNLTANLAARQQVYYSACHEGNAFVAAVNSGYDNGTDNGIIKKSIPITDKQSLDIALMSNSINKSTNSENGYRIIQWQIVNQQDTSYDYTLPVLK
ncbi:hypothetical protein [Butyrivibrio proteoclasticus]|uniref:hypothetical protein n=1 Tax=Butyrivibrio proteoclasticus TaxID=43305 RepID=UPI00047A31AC|nr:hypothetical protein [Butyrivibrio proteoclasticus]